MQKHKSIGQWRMTMRPIGVIRSCYEEKFGIPRQAGLAASAPADIELFPPYGREETVGCLDTFSHIWVHFLFHAATQEGWKPTVRPPALGGRTRVGIFASRSPHRPNHIGLSAVRLLGVTTSGDTSLLHVTGGDFLDESPVLDIKPYLAYSDSIETAHALYSGAESGVEVVLTEEVLEFCSRYEQNTGRDLRTLIEETLRWDPRPASQRRGKNRFGMRLWDVNVRWRVEENRFVVDACRRLNG